MKAYVLHGIADLRLEEISMPQLMEGEALVQVKAAGICGSDIPRIFQTGMYHFPAIPGHEFSGIVAETGKNVDKSWKNKRVGVFPLIPCRNCLPCQKGRYEMCRDYSYLGSRTDGGFAEYVAVPEWNLIELPQEASFEQAAMLEPMAVAVHAMRSIVPDRKEIAVVYGLGTIGTLLAMFLKEAGVERILAVGNKDFQMRHMADLGILQDSYFDSRNGSVLEWIMEQTQGAGADVIFECIGKNDVIADAVCAAAPGGRVVLAGNPYSDICLEKQVYWKILRNQLTISGTWNSSFTHKQTDDWHYVLDALVQGRIRPEQFISHRFPLEELEQGFHMMRDKTEDYIKIMCIMGY